MGLLDIKSKLEVSIMKYVLMSLLVALFTQNLWAAQSEAVVIEVRKKVKLHESERVYADYFIRGGSELGLTEGTLVSVKRRVPVHDPFDNKSVGDFYVKVADLEIIHSDNDKSIGRLVEIDRREARPMLTYDSVMIGDRLDLTTMRNKVSYHQAPSSVFEHDRQPASLPQPSREPEAEPHPEEDPQASHPTLTNPRG